jgi:nitroreductase
MAIASRHLGWKLTGELFPPAEPSPIVAVGRLERDHSTGDPLFAAITRRCVNRQPYRAATLAETLWIEFTGHATQVGDVNLSWVEDNPAKAKLAAVAAENDRLLFEHPALHAGLYRWIRWTDEEVARAADGMPIAALEIGGLERRAFRLLGSPGRASVLSKLGLSRFLPRRSRQIYEQSGAIAVLSVAGRQPADFVRVGEVLQRIWLTATLRGIALQPITGISLLLLRATLAGGEGLSRDQQSHLQRLATRLRELVSLPAGDLPAIIFRVGYARSPSARAPRLPLDEVLTVTPG